MNSQVRLTLLLGALLSALPVVTPAVAQTAAVARACPPSPHEDTACETNLSGIDVTVYIRREYQDVPLVQVAFTPEDLVTVRKTSRLAHAVWANPSINPDFNMPAAELRDEARRLEQARMARLEQAQP